MHAFLAWAHDAQTQAAVTEIYSWRLIALHYTLFLLCLVTAWKQAKTTKWRTIVYSVIASGIVALLVYNHVYPGPVSEFSLPEIVPHAMMPQFEIVVYTALIGVNLCIITGWTLFTPMFCAAIFLFLATNTTVDALQGVFIGGTIASAARFVQRAFFPETKQRRR